MKSENGHVTLSQLIDEVVKNSNYKDTIVKEIIMQFMNELRDSIINNEQVCLSKYFSFRHKVCSERRSNNLFGEPKIIPERMMVRLDVSKQKILQPLNELYKREKRRKKGLNENKIKDLN